MTKFWHAYHDVIYSTDETEFLGGNFFYERLVAIESTKRGLDYDGDAVWPAETEEAIQHRLEHFRPFTEEEAAAADATAHANWWAVDNHARCCGCKWSTDVPRGEPNGIFAGWTKEEVGGGWLS